MKIPHKPVLLKEILDGIESMSSKKSFLDVTFGRGGHSLAIQKRFPQIKSLVMDQDIEAIQWAHQVMPEDTLIYHYNFKNLEMIWPTITEKSQLEEGVDIIVVDLGVSSPQLDTPERGFSFYHKGPLDMRMDLSQKLMARDILNEWDEKDLLKLFKEQGEIRNPRPVVNGIIRTRKERPFLTTEDFTKVILKTCSWSRKNHHPATSYFLALRLEVNDELGALREGLPAMVEALNKKGRLFILTFHSLEATIVKKFLKQCSLEKKGNLINKKVIKPCREEILSNPRSRSAQLRIFERI